MPRRALPPATIPPAAPADEPPIDRIERFQTLEPGVYWRSLRAVTVPHPRSDYTTTIAAGTVLLLLKIETVEEKIHSAVLRYHPLDGDGEYQLLLADFLKNFEPALDGEEVRARELATLQKEIADLQTDLERGRTTPAIVNPIIQKGLKAWEKEEAQRRRRSGGGKGHPLKRLTNPEALVPPGGVIPTQLSHAITQRFGIVETNTLQHLVAREAQIAKITAEWITTRTEEITDKLQAMAPFLAEKAAIDLARSQGIQAYAEKLMAGLASLNLYNGIGVEVETITEGTEAPPDEPLTLCQRKLFMDEELAAWADVDSQFDFDDIATFDQALQTTTSLRDQVLPTARCVVSMAIRRQDVDYGDPWRSEALNAQNRRVFLLVRNGERITRVYSAEPSHENTRRLFPTRTELDTPFTGIDGETITFADLAYPTHHRAAEDLILHYRRFLLLLCGLDHRLHLFGTFYPPQEALHFISLDFQARYFRFLADDERDRALGAGRPPVLEWIQSRNDYLQSGSRVLCHHEALLTPETAPASQRYLYHRDHRSITTYATPLQPAEVHVTYRDHGHLYVDVAVKRNSWRKLERPIFNAKLDLTKAHAATENGFGYLCLDNVRAEDLTWYVHDRESRSHHAKFIRLFKLTATTLQTEEHTEAPVRAYLRAAALAAGVANPTDVDALIDDSIRTWRCANRGAALPSLDQKPALTPILNQLYAVRHQQDAWLARLEHHAAERDYLPLKAVLTGKNRLGLYIEVPPAARSDSLLPWRWVRRITLTVRKAVLSETSSRLVWLQDLPDARERELKRWPALTEWLNDGPEPLRLDQITHAHRLVNTALIEAKTLFDGPGTGIPTSAFNSLLARFRDLLYNAPGRRVPSVYLAVPIGAYIARGTEETTLALLVVSDRAERWLQYFGSAAQQAEVKDCFVRIYRNHEFARKEVAKPFHPRLAALYRLPDHPIAVVNSIAYPAHIAYQYAEDTSVRLEVRLTQWITADRHPEYRSTETPPVWFTISPDVWDGTEVHLEPLLPLLDPSQHHPPLADAANQS